MKIKKYRAKVDKEKLENSWEWINLDKEDYYKDGYIYGYPTYLNENQSVLCGDVIEVDSEYVNHEFWLVVNNADLEEVEDD